VGVWLQVELEGVTGHVAFDENGHRRDFKLSVSELNLNTDARPVLTPTNDNNDVDDDFCTTSRACSFF